MAQHRRESCNPAREYARAYQRWRNGPVPVMQRNCAILIYLPSSGSGAENRTGLGLSKEAKKCRDKTAIHFNAANGLVGGIREPFFFLPPSSVPFLSLASLSRQQQHGRPPKERCDVRPGSAAAPCTSWSLRHRLPPSTTPVLAAIPGSIYTGINLHHLPRLSSA